MQKLRNRLSVIPCLESTAVPPQSEYVVKRLDQLEELGKYSVIYEIARIETILGHTFSEPVASASTRTYWGTN